MGVNRELMTYQAQEIERTLAAKKLTVRIIGGIMGHRLTVFQMVKPAEVDLSAIQRQEEELALALGVTTCRVGRKERYLTVEIPRKDPLTVRLTDLVHHLPITPSGQMVLGVDEEDIPLLLPLSSPNVAHVLIAGTTGSGKTALARVMIGGLALTHPVRDLGLILIDPKRRGYAPFVGLPHLVHPLIYEPDEALEVLAWLVDEMQRRDRERKETPRLVVFIDELADLMLATGDPAENLLTRLVQRGREAGIHLIACTQKPTASVIGSLIKSNFPARIVGKVTDTNDAYVAAGLRGTGAERLLGRGDFLVLVGGEVIRLQAAYATETELKELVTALRGGRPAELQISAPTPRGTQRVPAGLQNSQSAIRNPQSEIRRGGQNKKPPTEAMVEFALTELKEHGEVSQREVRRFHQSEYDTDCNARRAKEAIDKALEQWNGEKEGVIAG